VPFPQTSVRHVAEQPSPLVVLPSSHSSAAPRYESPQRSGVHTPAMHHSSPGRVSHAVPFGLRACPGTPFVHVSVVQTSLSSESVSSIVRPHTLPREAGSRNTHAGRRQSPGVFAGHPAGVWHVKRQFDSQPSPFVGLPSSHSSSPPTAPSPHTGQGGFCAAGLPRSPQPPAIATSALHQLSASLFWPGSMRSLRSVIERPARSGKPGCPGAGGSK